MEIGEGTFLDRYKEYFLIALVGFTIYLNSLFGPFVWDDISQIENNFFVHSISNVGNFFLGSTFTPQNGTELQGLYYRPLMTTSFSVIYSFFGTQTFFYHFFQLFMHIANALLIFYFAKNFFKPKLALLLSLIFVVHPINTESVVYISTLADPLFFFFGIIALIIFQKGNITFARGAIISILLLCSLLSKETGVLFGLLIFLYYLIFRKKNAFNTLKALALILVPLGSYLYLRFILAKVFLEKMPDVPMMTAPLIDRFFTMPAIFLFYIQTFAFPKDLFIYQEWIVPQPNAQFYIPLIIDLAFLIGVSWLGVWIFRKRKKLFSAYLFFTLWFIAGVGLHMQILPLDMTVADHMFYFPLVGLLGVIGITIQGITHANHHVKQIGLTIIIIIICLLSLRTFIRNVNWYEAITLYDHDLKYQQNDRIENLLAGELIKKGRTQEALQHYESLLTRNPHETALYANLGQAHQLEGKFQKAEEIYKQGLTYDDTGVIYAYLANLSFKLGKVENANIIANQGLTKFPQQPSLLLISAVTSYKLGDKQKATEQIQKLKGISKDPKIEQFYQDIVNGTLNI